MYGVSFRCDPVGKDRAEMKQNVRTMETYGKKLPVICKPLLQLRRKPRKDKISKMIVRKCRWHMITPFVREISAVSVNGRFNGDKSKRFCRIRFYFTNMRCFWQSLKCDFSWIFNLLILFIILQFTPRRSRPGTADKAALPLKKARVRQQVPSAYAYAFRKRSGF